MFRGQTEAAFFGELKVNVPKHALFNSLLAKIVSAAGKGGVLAMPDPILGLRFGKFMLLVGTVKLAIALV
jgi:hypothetical protein